MRILLVGEYSRLHNSLKEGLQKLGHEVTILGLTDGFKKYSVDIEIKHQYQHGFKKKLRTFLFKFLNIDLHSLNVKKQIIKNTSKLRNYNIIQYINDSPFLCQPQAEKYVFNIIKKQNKHVFLLSCGVDFISVKYAYDEKLRYSILTPYLKNKTLKPHFNFILNQLNPINLNLHEFFFQNVIGVIASDLDYHIPLEGHKSYLGMIPNPINTDKITYIQPYIDDKIKIFHGINSSNYYKKGNDIFEKAIEIISLKYANKIEIKTVRSVPYEEYIKAFDDSHILLDMVYSYDQGYNALEAMAKGKVVFTGAEQEWLDYYQLEPDAVAINALPDVEYLVEKLSWLIENPDKIVEISKNARDFIEREHHYIRIAEKYLEKWKTAYNN